MDEQLDLTVELGDGSRTEMFLDKALKNNHDSHYAGKEIEPIDVIEETIQRLTKAGLNPVPAYCIGQSLKYILRAGLKEGEDVMKDLDKALNYQYRAKNGEWIPGDLK
jgi:hypothetical protein